MHLLCVLLWRWRRPGGRCRTLVAQRGRQQQQQTVGDAVDTLPPAAHSHHRHQAAAQQTGLTLSRSHAAAMLDIVSRLVIGFMTLGLVVRSRQSRLAQS